MVDRQNQKFDPSDRCLISATARADQIYRGLNPSNPVSFDKTQLTTIMHLTTLEGYRLGLADGVEKAKAAALSKPSLLARIARVLRF